MPFVTRPQVEQLSSGRWSLTDELVYRGRRRDWVVPVGFESDFASVPTPVRWLIPADGPWTAAAIVHDWFCTVGIEAGVITSRDADGVFRRMCRELGTPIPRRWLMWAGVRWGALTNPVRRPGIAPDLPGVLAISLVAAPVVLPVSVVVAIGLLVDAVLDRILGSVAGLFGRRPERSPIWPADIPADTGAGGHPAVIGSRPDATR